MSAHDDYLDPDRYGLFDEMPDNSIVEEAFSDYTGPLDLYRAIYKYTPCGPSVGMTVRYEEEPQDIEDWGREVTKSFYCGDLEKLGTWADMREAGMVVLSVGVSSIVEGVDYEVPYRELEVSPDRLAERAEEDETLGQAFGRLFYQLVDDVNAEAEGIWHDTHGCDTCAKHWETELGLPDGENDIGYITIWTECPACNGHGIPI